MSSAAEIPFPLMSPMAMPTPVSLRLAAPLCVFVKDEEVVVVAADGAGGAADAVQIELGYAACVQRKEVGLNLLGDGDLVLQALFFFLFFEQALEGAGHGVEGLAEFGELIGTGDADAIVESPRSMCWVAL